MAHVIRLSSLTDELVTIITGLTANTNTNRFNTYRESALRTLRQNNYARTNQFEVRNELEGLQEKFRIYDEDELADALGQRLDELAERSTKWTPEILKFLLHLSDRPLQNSTVDDIEFLEPPEKEAEPRYRWEDLASEDPLLRDKHVWRNIDYAAESSDDEETSFHSDMGSSVITETTSICSIHDGSFSHRGDLTLSTDHSIISTLQKSQFWRVNTSRDGLDKADKEDNSTMGEQSKTIFITELQAIREILFLLSGLPTSLFEIASEQAGQPQGARETPNAQTPSNSLIVVPMTSLSIPRVTPAFQFVLKHTSHQIFHEVLARFAAYGTSIGLLRTWIIREQAVPLLQSLQDEVTERLRQLNSSLCGVQERYIAPSRDIRISLIDVQAEVLVLVRPILKLSDLIKGLVSEPYPHAFRSLELLYEETCTAQMAGDNDMYKFMGTIFFDCFQIYLRPIRRWMEEGELSQNDRVFFVCEKQEEVELASLWQKRYKLRQTSTGTLHAPKFLQPASNKIFATGKSVVVLKQLGKYERVRSRPVVEEPSLDFGTVCDFSLNSLAPFSELFHIAFDDWIQSKHDATSSILRQCLLDECGLRASLRALENTFFMADGAAATSLANAIFEKLDSGKNSWNDRFTLTELVQATIGSLSTVDAGRLRASVNVAKPLDVQKSRKSVKPLVGISFSYNLPWPVQIIVTKDIMRSYQQVFSFLLQVRRSTYMLHGVPLGNNGGESDGNALYYNLRARLLWFNSTLYGYLTDLVIQTNTSKMRAALAEAADIGEMISLHRAYMKRLIDQGLLGTKLEPIYKTIITILDLSIQLSDARMAQETGANSNEIPPQSSKSFLRQSKRPSLRASLGGERRENEADDSDEHDSDHERDLIMSDAPEMRLSYMEELRNMRRQFDRLCRFVASGLKGVARAGGEPNWDMLADRLDSGLGVAV